MMIRSLDDFCPFCGGDEKAEKYLSQTLCGYYRNIWTPLDQSCFPPIQLGLTLEILMVIKETQGFAREKRNYYLHLHKKRRSSIPWQIQVS